MKAKDFIKEISSTQKNEAVNTYMLKIGTTDKFNDEEFGKELDKTIHNPVRKFKGKVKSFDLKAE